MRKMGNLTARDIGKWITVNGAEATVHDSRATEIRGLIRSIEYELGEDGKTPVTTLLLDAYQVDGHDVLGGFQADYVTRVHDWPCSTR